MKKTRQQKLHRHCWNIKLSWDDCGCDEPCDCTPAVIAKCRCGALIEEYEIEEKLNASEPINNQEL